MPDSHFVILSLPKYKTKCESGGWVIRIFILVLTLYFGRFRIDCFRLTKSLEVLNFNLVYTLRQAQGDKIKIKNNHKDENFNNLMKVY